MIATIYFLIPFLLFLAFFPLAAEIQFCLALIYTGICLLCVIAYLLYTRETARKKHGIMIPLISFFFIVSLALHLPVFLRSSTPFASLILSAYASMGIFLMSSPLDEILAILQSLNFSIIPFYQLMVELIYLIAPVLTFNTLLLFAGNALSRFHLFVHPFRHIYVFSVLNQPALSLARSLKQNHPNSTFVFSNSDYDNQQSNHESLATQALSIGGICFSCQAEDLPHTLYYRWKQVTFFLISNNEDDNTHQALNLIHSHGHDSNKHLYVFASSAESQLLLNNGDHAMRVLRVNPTRSLVNQTLYEKGHLLFRRPAWGPVTSLTAAIIGMGQVGSEMLKALCWYCQMDYPTQDHAGISAPGHFKIELHGFDRKTDFPSQLQAQCPELMKSPFNGNSDPEDALYSIQLHPGTDAASEELLHQLIQIDSLDYVLIALGSDTLNIQTALRVRQLCAKIHTNPVIHAVVRDSMRKEQFEAHMPAASTDYPVILIGDLDTCYSERMVMSSELEWAAFSIHKDYLMAAALQKLAAVKAGASDKEVLKLTQAQKEADQAVETAGRVRDAANAIASSCNIKATPHTVLKNFRRQKLFLDLTNENHLALSDRFYGNEYNYRSSIASAMASSLRRQCGLYGTEDKGDTLWSQNGRATDAYRSLEHRRWNAYMRTEGYSYAASRSKIARQHPLMVPFSQLPAGDRHKDNF